MMQCRRVASSLLGVLLGLMAQPFGIAVGAEQLVVVEARGLNLQPGQTIDGSKPFTLTEGQKIVLISSAGKIVTLRGPAEQPAFGNEVADKADVAGALNTLITQKMQRAQEAGVVRGGEVQLVPSEPWLLDVSRPGTRCIPQGMMITLWRPEFASAETVTVSPLDRSWRTTVEWSAGSDRVTLPDMVPVPARATFVVRSAGKDISMTLVGIPPTVETNAMRAAWMSESGCDGQALALVRQMTPN